MTDLKAIEIIENEILCLNRRAANKCNGGEDCATCVLVLPDTAIRQAYALAIERLKSADNAPLKHAHWSQVDKTKCRCSNCDIIALIGLYPHGDKCQLKNVQF